MAEVDVFSVSEDQVDRAVEVSSFLQRFLVFLIPDSFCLVDKVVQYRTILIAEQQCILKLLFKSFIILLAGVGPAGFGFLIAVGLMLADVVIKILKSRAIELTNLLKAFFELNQLQFW